MRYEAKHNHIKKLANHIGNYVNIAWTLANRLQYWQCYQWSGNEVDLTDECMEIGPGNNDCCMHKAIIVSQLHN